MNTLNVDLGERSYPIHIGPGLINRPVGFHDKGSIEFGNFFHRFSNSRIMQISFSSIVATYRIETCWMAVG